MRIESVVSLTLTTALLWSSTAGAVTGSTQITAGTLGSGISGYSCILAPYGNPYSVTVN